MSRGRACFDVERPSQQLLLTTVRGCWCPGCVLACRQGAAGRQPSALWRTRSAPTGVVVTPTGAVPHEGVFDGAAEKFGFRPFCYLGCPMLS
jgi:hypothetical protein